MKRFALLVVLTGCNAIFGLDETITYDAGRIYEDAMVDAPPTCPDPSVVPQFDRELHQAVYADQNCYTYQASDIGIALAMCRDPITYVQHVSEARVGPITEMYVARGDINDENYPIYSFALAPEGNEAIAWRYDPGLAAYGVWRYERDASGNWDRREQLAFPTTISALSTMSRGPYRHAFVRLTTNELHEFAQDTTSTWADVGTYAFADFGMSYVYTLDMSADGLRMMVFGIETAGTGYTLGYTYRTSITDRFGPLTKIPSFASTYLYDLYFTSDCDRLYFPGFGAVFYVKRVP